MLAAVLSLFLFVGASAPPPHDLPSPVAGAIAANQLTAYIASVEAQELDAYIRALQAEEVAQVAQEAALERVGWLTCQTRLALSTFRAYPGSMSTATTTSHTPTALFATVARALQAECARQSLVCPAFRAPPMAPGPRTIRRCPEAVVVAVRLDRDVNLVTADLIDGTVRAQGPLEPDEAETIRQVLWAAASEALGTLTLSG